MLYVQHGPAARSDEKQDTNEARCTSKRRQYPKVDKKSHIRRRYPETDRQSDIMDVGAKGVNNNGWTNIHESLIIDAEGNGADTHKWTYNHT